MPDAKPGRCRLSAGLLSPILRGEPRNDPNKSTSEEHMRRTYGAGIALAVSLTAVLCASPAAAQARSQERIRITKSSSGEVVRVDTIHDTITVRQLDTVV